MAYVIDYGGTVNDRFLSKKKMRIHWKRIAICISIALLLFVWTITPARIAVLDLLLPGNGAVTRHAAQNMFREIENGQTFREAFADFCIEVFENP